LKPPPDDAVGARLGRAQHLEIVKQDDNGRPSSLERCPMHALQLRRRARANLEMAKSAASIAKHAQRILGDGAKPRRLKAPQCFVDREPLSDVEARVEQESVCGHGTKRVRPHAEVTGAERADVRGTGPPQAIESNLEKSRLIRAR